MTDDELVFWDVMQGNGGAIPEGVAHEMIEGRRLLLSGRKGSTASSDYRDARIDQVVEDLARTTVYAPGELNAAAVEIVDRLLRLAAERASRLNRSLSFTLSEHAFVLED